MQSILSEIADTMNEFSHSQGFDIHEIKCGNGAGLGFKCLPIFSLSAVGDRDLSADRVLIQGSSLSKLLSRGVFGGSIK